MLPGNWGIVECFRYEYQAGQGLFFYIRSVNQVGKSAFVEAVGRASDDAKGYLDFFKGLISESHLGAELLGKVELSQDNASKLEQFSKEWQDANKNGTPCGA